MAEEESRRYGWLAMKRIAGITAFILVVAAALFAFVLNDGDSDKGGRFTSKYAFRQSLTARDRAKVPNMIARDSKLKHILGKHGYEIRSIGLWPAFVIKRHRELLDCYTTAVLDLQPPIKAITTKWPLLGGSKLCSDDYDYNWVRFKLRGLRQVFVYVNLRNSHVAAIGPGAARQTDLD